MRRSVNVLIALLLLQGCVSQQAGDPVLVQAEKTDQIAFETINTFLEVEHANLAFCREKLPQVHGFAQTLRKEAPATFRALRSAENEYRLTRDLATQTNAMSKLDQVSAWAKTAREFLILIDQTKKGTP